MACCPPTNTWRPCGLLPPPQTETAALLSTNYSLWILPAPTPVSCCPPTRPPTCVLLSTHMPPHLCLAVHPLLPAYLLCCCPALLLPP